MRSREQKKNLKQVQQQMRPTVKHPEKQLLYRRDAMKDVGRRE